MMMVMTTLWAIGCGQENKRPEHFKQSYGSNPAKVFLERASNFHTLLAYFRKNPAVWPVL